MRIFDYTHRLKGNYFIYVKDKVVLMDTEYQSLRPSSFSLRLFFRLKRWQLYEIPPGSALYQDLLTDYIQLVDNLIFMNKSQFKYD
ncbi:hypothetical protein LVD17_03065 [Fulvivirga ulvae]|uniref:hypothetical protein n=1 Tax=Fulvivirga ulvae TaxID=2904245 RepID=UPI001F200135|nr:hypothetical protein [Fulvivirga ulvae]UII32246.1 hypothetical protein LVD17_00145 [Fulvivirga ulvae]UII32812.1 hypothetical protein LVD17_03065 [Fulvivirga ulvae]